MYPTNTSIQWHALGGRRPLLPFISLKGQGATQSKSGCAIAGTSIGKSYARADQLGTPFAITVDRDTLDAGAKQGTVTVRERDTTLQVGSIAHPCFAVLGLDPTLADVAARLCCCRYAATFQVMTNAAGSDPDRASRDSRYAGEGP